jgi:UDP-glucuronate 4-epimerase
VTRNVLVTGAYGLIGHESVLALRAAGYEVVATDILSERPNDAGFDASPLAVAGVDQIFRMLDQNNIEAIVHAAGVSGPMFAKDRPHSVLSTNVGGAIDLYEAARLASVGRIVLISSAGAYGETGEVAVDERTRLGATGAYGVSKICAEQVAHAYASHGVETVVLRPSWVYGPRRRTTCVIKTMVNDALSNQPTHLPYGAGFPRQFVHVTDVAASVAAALTTSRGVQSAYNITDGSRYLLDDLAHLVRERLPGARIELASGPDPDDVICGPMDISSARADLDWQPTIDLPTGLDQMIVELSSRR